MSSAGTKRKHSEDNISPKEVKKSRMATAVAPQTAIGPKVTKRDALAAGADQKQRTDKYKDRKTGWGKPASPIEFQVCSPILSLESHPDRTRTV